MRGAKSARARRAPNILICRNLVTQHSKVSRSFPNSLCCPFPCCPLSLVRPILCSAAICCCCCCFCAVQILTGESAVIHPSTALNCWKRRHRAPFTTTKSVSLRQPTLPPHHASLTRNWISTGCICLCCEVSDLPATRPRVTGGLETISSPVRRSVLPSFAVYSPVCEATRPASRGLCNL